MKKFTFRLDRVRDWRRQILDREEMTLQSLLAAHRALQHEAVRVDQDDRDTQFALARTIAADARDLAAAAEWRVHLQRLRLRIQERLADSTARVDAQRDIISDARRNVRLLDRLEQRRRGEWRAALDREAEALAGELYLARRYQGTDQLSAA
ncbi:MAG: hypothetical protein ACRD96_18925 [Bryobacteraceae bacterium]